MPPRLPVEPLPAIFLIPQALARARVSLFALFLLLKLPVPFYPRPHLPRNDTPGTAKRLVFCSFIKFESL